MADVLSVIADILKQDKQQKREHFRMMRSSEETERKRSRSHLRTMGASWGWKNARWKERV